MTSATDDSASPEPTQTDPAQTEPAHHAGERTVAQRRAVRTLSTTNILSGVGIAGAVPAAPLLAVSLAGSEAVAGLAQTFSTIGAALVALPLARIALSRGRRAALATGYGTGALGALVVIVAAVHGSIALLLTGTLLVGVASAASYQARYAATDLAEPHHRARALSIVVWAATIGSVAGPNLLNASGSLGMRLGLPQLAGPYVVNAVMLGAAALIVFAVLRPDPYLLSIEHAEQASGQKVRRPSLRDGIEHLRTRPRAVLGMSIVAVGHIVMVAIMVMTPVHMTHVDVTLQVVGLVISVHIAGMYAFSPLVGMAVDRWGRMAAAYVGIAILLVSAVISGLAPADDALVLGTGLFLLGLGWSFTLIAGSTMVIDNTEATERPAVQGLSDLVMNVAGAVGGILAGLIVAFASYGWLAAASTIPLLALTAVMLRFRRQGA